MKLCDHLKPDCIFLGKDLPAKEAVLRFAAEKFSACGEPLDADTLFSCMMKRETVMSTGVGDGVGIPHGACKDLEEAHVLLVSLSAPVDYQALDNQPVDIIVAMVVPDTERELHLRLLACIARVLKNRKFGQLVRVASDPDTLYQDLLILEKHIALQ